MLRIIIPGYTLGETVINNWVEVETPTPSTDGNGRMSIHHPTGLNDYIDIDLSTYFNSKSKQSYFEWELSVLF
jgi:hypothetical protein